MTFQDELKTELEQAAAAVPHAEPGGMEHIRRRRDQRRRTRYTGWVVVSLLVVAGVLTVNLPDGTTNTPVLDSQPSPELPDGVVEVPASHPARQIAEETATFETFQNRAMATLVMGANVDFWACGLSEVGVCYVVADGIVAVSVFDAPRRAVAVVTGPDINGEVTVPLNTEALFGVESDATEIYISVRDSLGDELTGVGGDWDAAVTTFSIAALDLPLMQRAERIASDDIFSDDLRVAVDPQPADQLYQVPIPDTDHALLVRLRPGAHPHMYATACSVLVLVDLPAGWEGTCLEMTLEGDRQLGEFTYSDAVDAATVDPSGLSCAAWALVDLAPPWPDSSFVPMIDDSGNVEGRLFPAPDQWGHGYVSVFARANGAHVPNNGISVYSNVLGEGYVVESEGGTPSSTDVAAVFNPVARCQVVVAYVTDERELSAGIDDLLDLIATISLEN